MKFSILVALSLFSQLSLAGEIITDTQQIELLQKSARENPYYRKIGLVKYEIFYFDIGKPTTPFYSENSQIKRFYKNETKCFELTILEKKNIARKVRCLDKAKTLTLKGFEDFKVVEKSELLAEGLQGFKTNEFSSSFKLLAYLQEYDDYAMDRAIYGREMEKLAPKREFNVTLGGFTEVKLDEKNFELKQFLLLHAEKIGLLSEKTSTRTNIVKPEPGALIFSNGQGRVLIYNPYLRSPFGTHELVFNQELPPFLTKLAQDSSKAPVCFRDDYLSPKPNDCHKLIFNTQSLGAYISSKIVEINFAKQKVIFR